MKYSAFKRKVFDIIDTNAKSKWSKVFDTSIITLIAVNVVLIFMDTFEAMGSFATLFHVIETFSVIVFSIEYILRFWTADFLYPTETKAKARLKYALSFMAIIDLISIVPFFFGSSQLIVLRALRIFRLLRVFKFARYTKSFSTVGIVIKKRASQLFSSVLVVFMLMIIGSIFMYHVEHDANPDNFRNVFDALWWAVATITTVGYGDIAPTTAVGKILGALVALMGIGLVAIPTGILSAGFLESVSDQLKRQRREELRHKEIKEKQNRFLDDPIYENETMTAMRADDLKKDTLEGSFVIIPKSKAETPFALVEEEWLDMRAMLVKIKSYVDEKYKPDGYTIGWNVGKASGQTVTYTCLHIIPRFNDEKYAGRGLRTLLKED